MKFKKQTIYNAVLSILILMLPSASDPERLFSVTCLKRNETICCPTKCSEKCHSNNTFERANCRSYTGKPMQCINVSLHKNDRIDLLHCLNNINHTNNRCIITKAYSVTCNNNDLNKQGLWKAPEQFHDQYAKCNGKKENKVECTDAGGKLLHCANPNCGFNSPLGENDICNITPAYDVECINNKQNTHCSEEHWKAPPNLTFVNASCWMKDDKLECRDVGGTPINCEEHQKCGFSRTFKKDDICYIAQAYNVDCNKEKERTTCCQEACDWKAPSDFQFSNASCQMKDKKLECRAAELDIKCDNDQNCGFNRFLGQDEICYIKQSINLEKRGKGLEKKNCNDGFNEQYISNDSEIPTNTTNTTATNHSCIIGVVAFLFVLVCVCVCVCVGLCLRWFVFALIKGYYKLEKCQSGNARPTEKEKKDAEKEFLPLLPT